MTEQLNLTFQNYRAIYNVILCGTYGVVTVLSALLIISFFIYHQPQTFGAILVCFLAFGYIAIVYVLLHRGHELVVGYMLLVFYFLLGAGIVWIWGVNTPMGILIFALVIVLAAILLTVRHALFAALAATLTLILVQLHGGASWTGNASSFGDVFAYSTVFGMLTLITWLYTSEIDRSFARAQHAQAALRRQKAMLKIQVQQKTAQLRQSQLQEIQHLYRFAELGQSGVTLLHDLANLLTALTLEIDGLQNTEHAKAISRARYITDHLSKIVVATRQRLNGEIQQKSFNCIYAVTETVHFVYDKAKKAHVTIDWQPPAEKWLLRGDPVSLQQVIAIITYNAIEALASAPPQKRIVVITMKRSETHIVICVRNLGKKITEAQSKKLFVPFQSTKKTGMGIGLIIAKQSVEMQFGGTLTLNPKCPHTEFIISIPFTYGR